MMWNYLKLYFYLLWELRKCKLDTWWKLQLKIHMNVNLNLGIVKGALFPVFIKVQVEIDNHAGTLCHAQFCSSEVCHSLVSKCHARSPS